MNDNILTIITILVGSTGAIGGLVTLLRLRSDTARTTVAAAEGAVIVQKEVITSLVAENTRLREERDELRDLLQIIDERKLKRHKEGK